MTTRLYNQNVWRLTLLFTLALATLAAVHWSPSWSHMTVNSSKALESTSTFTSMRSVSSTLSSNIIWRPGLVTSWQLQLTGPVDPSLKVEMYDVDMFDNNASFVGSLHAQGRKVVCYFSAGSWEDWRPDAKQFPTSLIGKEYVGWPGEKWLDIRRIDILGPIMQARMNLCKQKGFAGVDPDNVQGYSSDTGFPLTYQDQITYNIFLANEAHARGLSIGLKNDLGQINDLLPYFDWALSEECFYYQECNALLPFTQAGKAVFEVEYKLEPSQFCPEANAMNFNALLKNLDLNAQRVPCR